MVGSSMSEARLDTAREDSAARKGCEEMMGSPASVSLCLTLLWARLLTEKFEGVEGLWLAVVTEP